MKAAETVLKQFSDTVRDVFAAELIHHSNQPTAHIVDRASRQRQTSRC
jgi:hypothetical protein